MTLVKSDIPRLLTTGLKTLFFQSLQETPALWDQIATVIKSDQDTEDYAWLGSLPGMREFVDERQPGQLHEYDYTLKNKTWESTLAIDRTAIEDDQYGQIALRVQTMGSQARRHLDQLVFGLLAQGFAAPSYDGAPMFGTHGTQSNKGVDALTASSLQAAFTQIMRLQDDQGNPAGIMPDVLVVPPDLKWEAMQILNSEYYPDPLIGATQELAANVLKGMFRLVVSLYLLNPANWYLLDTTRAVRPIVLQMRQDFEFMSLEGDTETGFLRDQYYYGIRARYNAGYGEWRGAFGSQAG